jgi:hypothetical protein
LDTGLCGLSPYTRGIGVALKAAEFLNAFARSRFMKKQDQRRITILLLLLLFITGFCQWKNNKFQFMAQGTSRWTMLGGLGGAFWTTKASETKTAPTIAEEVNESITEALPLITLPVKFPEPKRKRVAAVGTAQPTTTLETITHTRPATDSTIEVGVDATYRWILPTVRYQISIADATVLGVQFSYAENFVSSPKATMWGGGISLSYFLNGQAFDGMFLQGMAELYDIKAETRFRASHVTPAVISCSVGWMGRIAERFHYSAAGGVGWTETFGKDPRDIEISKVSPVIRVGVGYDF